MSWTDRQLEGQTDRAELPAYRASLSHCLLPGTVTEGRALWGCGGGGVDRHSSVQSDGLWL